MQIGNPSSKGSSKSVKKNYFYLKSGTQYFRILPPMGDLANNNKGWSRFYAVHFGYKNTSGKQRPFLSCEVKNRGMIEVACPATERLKTLTSQYEELKVRAKTSNNPKVTAALEKLKALVDPREGIFKLEKRHYVNAIDAQGNIGLLQLKHKEKLAVEEVIKRSEDKYGVHPAGVEGLYLEFTKSGKALDTVVTVLPQMVVMADKSERPYFHTLNEDVIERLATEAFNLNKLYPELTAEQIQRIVDAAEAGNEGKVVEEVLNEFYDSKKTEVEKVESKPSAQTAPKAPVSTPAKNVAVEEEEDFSMADEEIDPMTEVGIVAAAPKVEEKVKAAPKKVTPPAPAEDDDDDAFLASLLGE